jgi:large subunit ribosomal protein L4
MVEAKKITKSVRRPAAKEAVGKLSLPVFNLKGEKVGRISLPEEIFGVKVNQTLLSQAVRVHQANLRQGNSSTKTRGLIRGGGRKPWRQKGTGRARQGSIRSPQWRGGGIVFGPQTRDYSLSFPDKMRKAALRSALTSRVEDIVVVNEFKLTKSKTKQVGAALERLNISGNTLMVLPEYDPSVARASRNMPAVRLTKASDLNALEVLSAKKLLFAKDAVKKLIGVKDDAP